MRHYQIFPFDMHGRLSDAVAMDLENDVRAIRRALETEFPFGCELWEGFRFVGRFHAPAAALSEAPAETLPGTAPDTLVETLAEAEAPPTPRKPALLH